MKENIFGFYKDAQKNILDLFLYDEVLKPTIKSFNGMAVKSFYEATLKNQFAIGNRTEKWRLFEKQSRFLYKLTYPFRWWFNYLWTLTSRKSTLELSSPFIAILPDIECVFAAENMYKCNSSTLIDFLLSRSLQITNSSQC